MVDEKGDMRAELDRLRAELDVQLGEAAAKERQLERYASDLRETFTQERARAQQLQASYAATVRALANAVEARDAYTGGHAERVAAYGLLIAAEAEIRLDGAPELEFAFLLHDIGKVAIPDSILFKPSGLTPEEREVMETHPVRGATILSEIDFLGAARDVVRHHHERWDGSGYPDGLAGEQIPLAARVFAVADTIDALTSDRPYRRAGSLATARATIADGTGTQFDPAIVEVYSRIPDAVFAALREEIG